MKVTQIRNATALIELDGQGILIDPMFAPQGAIPSLKYATFSRRRNPLVELPDNFEDILDRVTCCLITHCQKGHFDHLDRRATKWLRENQIPVYCSEQDYEFLLSKGLKPVKLDADKSNEFFSGTVSLVPCLHGKGAIGKMMAHGYGYHIKIPGEKSLYISGDTILTEDVRSFVTNTQPDILLIPGGGARFDLGGEIIMGKEEVIEMGTFATGHVIVNHLESLDHCPVSREEIRVEVDKRLWNNRYSIPLDGESINFNNAQSIGA